MVQRQRQRPRRAGRQAPWLSPSLRLLGTTSRGKQRPGEGLPVGAGGVGRGPLAGQGGGEGCGLAGGARRDLEDADGNLEVQLHGAEVGIEAPDAEHIPWHRRCPPAPHQPTTSVTQLPARHAIECHRFVRSPPACCYPPTHPSSAFQPRWGFVNRPRFGRRRSRSRRRTPGGGRGGVPDGHGRERIEVLDREGGGPVDDDAHDPGRHLGAAVARGDGSRLPSRQQDRGHAMRPEPAPSPRAPPPSRPPSSSQRVCRPCCPGSRTKLSYQARRCLSRVVEPGGCTISVEFAPIPTHTGFSSQRKRDSRIEEPSPCTAACSGHLVYQDHDNAGQSGEPARGVIGYQRRASSIGVGIAGRPL